MCKTLLDSYNDAVQPEVLYTYTSWQYNMQLTPVPQNEGCYRDRRLDNETRSAHNVCSLQVETNKTNGSNSNLNLVSLWQSLSGRNSKKITFDCTSSNLRLWGFESEI